MGGHRFAGNGLLRSGTALVVATVASLSAPIRGISEDRASGTFVVVNGSAETAYGSSGFSQVLRAARALVGGDGKRLLDAGAGHVNEFHAPLAVDAPSQEATAKARWLREWLRARMDTGGTLVLVGNERVLPTWQVSHGPTVTSDSFYSDLDGDGVPDTAVCRVVGTPELMVRQLRGKRDYGERATILCSEDTRIHLETRAFLHAFSARGYEISIRGVRDTNALVSSDFIVHFGHGSPSGISNRWGEEFVSAGNMPALPRSPIVFVDGCGTLPVGSPLLHAFLEKGALAYLGSTETVQGMIPARFTNELVEHFLRILDERPEATLPQVLTAARAAYVRGHPGLDARLRELADTGRIESRGDEATHLLTVAEWVCYGDPNARIPRRGPTRPVSRQIVSLTTPVRLEEGRETWRTVLEIESADGQAVLSLFAEVPVGERTRFGLSVRQDGDEVAVLDGRDDTIYQHLGSMCRGGHVAGERYRARFLLPLRHLPGKHPIEVRLIRGSLADLVRGTGIDIWPDDFARRIGLRREPGGRPTVPAAGDVARPGEAVKVDGRVRLRPTGVPRYAAVDLSPVFNRSHRSVQVGGGDNASFRTWFAQSRVSVRGVPFLVKKDGDRAENDVLVSANNTQNVFELEGMDVAVKAVHLLIWGYNRPREPARVRIMHDDGSTQDCQLALEEWTDSGPAAFDFENTVRGFEHARVLARTITVEHPERRLVGMSSSGGTYGLVAITLER